MVFPPFLIISVSSIASLSWLCLTVVWMKKGYNPIFFRMRVVAPP